MSTAVRATGAVAGGAKRHRAIKVMIVDDSLTVRTIFSRTIESQPDLIVEATANSAEQAIALLEHTILDVILLDLEMPGMGGLAALPTLLEKARHAQIIVVSSLTDEGAKYTLEALAIGAADTLLKPTSGRFDVDYRALLLGKIRALSAGSAEPSAVAAASRSLLPTVRAPSRQTASILAICGSTGGIHALCLMLEKLPASLGVPILVTQHLPASFMSVFARQVGMAASRPAEVAPAGTVLEPDKIYIAPGTGHMIIENRANRYVTGLNRAPARSGCTPSADPMFSSLATAFGSRALGVVLSGMGMDGAVGAAQIVEAGGTIIAQDQASSAVWGMPRAVAEAGLAAAILPPERIATEIIGKTDKKSWK